MPAPVPRQERDFLSLQSSQHVGIGRVAKRSVLLNLAHGRKPGHGIEPTSSDDSDFRQRQAPSLDLQQVISKPTIIQKLLRRAALVGARLPQISHATITL